MIAPHRPHLALAALALVCSACLAPRPEPIQVVEAAAPVEEVVTPPNPNDLADQVLEALGGKAAWDDTRHVAWTFFGQRRHLWDRHAGRARVERGELVVLLDLATREGLAYEAGVEVEDPEALRDHLDRAYAWWVNDSYWMFMPYKLRDPGTRLAYGGSRKVDGRLVEVLELSFESGVGLTPLNRYEILIDAETHLVSSWVITAAPDEPARDLGPWRGWERFGEVLLATDHGRDFDWQIAVHDELPLSAYEDPAPSQF